MSSRAARTRAVAVLAATGLLVAWAGAVGVGAFGKLLAGGLDDPRSDSSRAARIIDQRFGGSPNLVLLVTARTGTVDSPAAVAAGLALTRNLSTTPGVTRVASYWPARSSLLRSTDRRYALVVATVPAVAVATRLVEHYERPPGRSGPVTIRPGGPAGVVADVSHQVSRDITRVEAIVIPLTLLLLVVAFGGLVAAVLPVAVGIVGIIGGLAVLSLLADHIDVSVFAINLTTALGLGLGVDYALLMVSRFREEMAAGLPAPAAAAAARRTAGRTIAFSGATVAGALAVMLVFPPYFLRSMAYAGIAVTLITVVTAVFSIPALLCLLGPRVDAVPIPSALALLERVEHSNGRHRDPARRVPDLASESPFWRRTALAVMRRPLLSAVPVVVVLVVAGTPFLHATFGMPDERTLSGHAASRQVGDVVRADFTADVAGALDVVVDGPVDLTALSRYSRALSALPAAARVDGIAGTWSDGRPTAAAATRQRTAEHGAYLRLVPAVPPDSAAVQRLVHAVRAVPSPGPRVFVGGPPAVLVDGKATVASRLPVAATLIVLATVVLLFLFTGSVVLPLKAIVLNALTLFAVMGTAVWIFQYGHFAWLFGFTPGPLDTSVPVLLFCITFGLSMDYEVFLLSRIIEERERGASDVAAVATGLARVGRIVTTAASLIAVTFAAFGTSSVRFIQMFGVCTGIAVVIDAVLVRAVLVPAFIRLAGQANWWAPARLRRWHERLGLREGASVSSGWRERARWRRSGRHRRPVLEAERVSPLPRAELDRRTMVGAGRGGEWLR